MVQDLLCYANWDRNIKDDGKGTVGLGSRGDQKTERKKEEI